MKKIMAPASLTQSTETTLAQLASEINAEHDRCVDALQKGLQHALSIGERLLEAKAQVAHGEWGTWLAANVTFSDRTARGYMRVVRELPKTATVADLGLRDALKLLAVPRVEYNSPDQLKRSRLRELEAQIRSSLQKTLNQIGSIVKAIAIRHGEGMDVDEELDEMARMVWVDVDQLKRDATAAYQPGGLNAEAWLACNPPKLPPGMVAAN